VAGSSVAIERGGSLQASSRPGRDKVAPFMDNDVIRKLIWSGMLAATGAIASMAAYRLSAFMWRRIFDEDPPE
jgi:hypothetical protein